LTGFEKAEIRFSTYWTPLNFATFAPEKPDLMNYIQILEYLFDKLPMYQRVGRPAYKADLNNTIALTNLLGNPQQHFKAVHIAGTNGKGSTSHIIASVLQEAGYKTGLYTSPHYKDFRERIKINGQMVPKKIVVDFIEKWKGDFEQIGLSFFEMTVGLAFSYFADEKVDVAVVEVGLGGRLDSTNIITPEVSVITNIGLDHIRYLGNTLREIAQEKAGIIKPHVPVVIGETRKEIKQVFIDTALKNNSEILFADQKYDLKKTDDGISVEVLKNGKPLFKKLTFPLLGSFQLKNLCSAIAALEELRESGFKISNEDQICGIENVIKNTGLQGRWQQIGQTPKVIADSGHNLDGIRQVVQNIESVSFNKLHFVFGVVNDKALDDILKILPKQASYYFCKANIPRGMDAELLQAEANKSGLSGKPYSSVQNAYKAALANSNEDDLVFVGGSTFVVAEVI
jgi:dihydrofolate synthase/folylpolyglutamate synthase